ncbi:MAG: hypothetical protein WBI82_09160 [Sphaerochaeta sp.]
MQAGIPGDCIAGILTLSDLPDDYDRSVRLVDIEGDHEEKSW